MNKNKAHQTATIAIFFAIMLVIQLISNMLFTIWPMPIRPTLVHIPVIIAAILYGPKIGSSLGFLMGMMSLITNSIVILPTSYLFSPFVPNGNLASLLIAILPRILIGITPYLIYKRINNPGGLVLSGLVGSLTNTVFVLSGIFIFFAKVYGGNVKALLAAIISSNALAEMIIAAILVTVMIPRLEAVKKNKK